MDIPIFAHISAISHLLPAYAGVRRWNDLQRPLKILAVFACFGVLVEIIEFILARMGIHNLFLLNFYDLIQVECFTYLYFLRAEKRVHKDILQVVGMLYGILWTLEVSFKPFPNEFNELIAVAANIVLIVMSLFLLNSIFNKMDRSLKEYSIFWIGIGELIYCTGTIIIFAFSNEILKMGSSYFNAFWHVNWTLTIVANISFTKSFQCKIF